MKKFMSLAVLAALSFNTFAATSQNLTLKGMVPKKLSILITPGTGSNSPTALNLELSPTDLVVGVASERSNSYTGYKVSASSLNLGFLVNTAHATEKISYSMKYDGVAVNLGAASDVKIVTNNTIHSDESDIAISYVGVPHQNRVEGTYQDVVTFTIAAN